MLRRIRRAARVILWIAALVLCRSSAHMLGYDGSEVGGNAVLLSAVERAG